MTVIYALAVDGYPRTIDPDTRLPFTLVTAMQSAQGCRGAQVLKAAYGGGWKVVVDKAGTQHDKVHVATGHRLLPSRARRRAWWDRYGWNRRRAVEVFLAELGQ